MYVFRLHNKKVKNNIYTYMASGNNVGYFEKFIWIFCNPRNIDCLSVLEICYTYTLRYKHDMSM